MTAPERRICRPRSAVFAISASRVAAQHAVPVAIAVAEVAAAEGRFRAVIKLIVDAAMVRAIGPAGEILRPCNGYGTAAAVARAPASRRGRQVRLPRSIRRRRGRCRHGGGQGGEHKNFHHRASPHSLVRDRTDCRASGGPAIDGASRNRRGSASAAAGLRGKRMVNRAPSPSLLSTATCAAMHVDHHLDEVKADAGADDPRDVAAAVIALEQPVEVGGGNADAVIGDGDDDLVAGQRGIHLDDAAVRRVFDGVGQNIAENLKQQFCIADHGHRRCATRSAMCAPGTISRCNWQTSCSSAAISISAG